MKQCATCERRVYDDLIKFKKIEFDDGNLYFCEHCIEILKMFESYGIGSDKFKYVDWENFK